MRPGEGSAKRAANLAGGDATEAEEALEDVGKTGANRLRFHLRDQAPEEHCESMIANAPLYRDTMAASEEQGGGE